MKTSRFSQILIYTICFVIVPALRAETPDTSINPALIYWQAAAVSPTLTGAQSKELREAARQGKVIPAEKWESLGFAPAERLILKASLSTGVCDWGLLIAEGPEMSAPHLSKVMELANVATARAEMLFDAGKPNEGRTWLLTAHRIARHGGKTKLLLTFMVQNVIEKTALKAAARHCLGWDEQARKDYARHLTALPPLATLQQSLQGEIMLLDWLENRDPASRSTALRQLFSTDTDLVSSAADILKLSANERFAREASEYRAIHARMVELCGQSWKESQSTLENLSAELLQGDCVLAKTMLPSLESVRENWFELATLRTMLEAALQHAGALDDSSLSTYRDSFEGGPLQLKVEGIQTSIVAGSGDPSQKPIELLLGK